MPRRRPAAAARGACRATGLSRKMALKQRAADAPTSFVLARKDVGDLRYVFLCRTVLGAYLQVLCVAGERSVGGGHAGRQSRDEEEQLEEL